jgi:D-alanine-D-alanine ligase
MQICILSDEESEDFDPAPFMEGYDWDMITVKPPIMEQLHALAESQEYDVYLNMCEGYEEDDSDPNAYDGIEVVKALEKLNLPFTGADSKFYDPTREQMQAIAEKHGIRFARGYQVKSVEEAEQLAASLPYPIMVKHPKSYGSTGMIKESRVDTPDQLRTQVDRVCREFGAARMEEFIIGKEYNVLVVDNPDDLGSPICYPPAELVFPPGEEFWHVDVKWNYDVPFDFKQVTDPELVARLHDIGRRIYLATGATGYGRCDIRMSEQGELCMLEINPNGGIMFKPEEYGPADYMILYDPQGYKGFFDTIFRAALLRQQLRSESKQEK